MEAKIAYHKQMNILKSSSSGGVFFALAQKVIRENGIVYGAAFATDGSVFHKKICEKSELGQLLGSKYVESSLGNALNEIKAEASLGKNILFAGTPCQVAAVRKYVETNKLENVFLVDFVCHGTPEKRFWKDYLEKLQQQYGKIIGQINFRDQRNGWRNYGTSIEFEKKKYYKSHYRDEYMYYFLKDYLLKDSCYHCPFRQQKEKASDVTLADAWQAPRNKEGTSLVFINTEKGNNFFENIRNELVVVGSVEVPDSTEISGRLEKKAEFLKDYEQWGFSKKLKKKYMSGKEYYINIMKSIYSKFVKR